MTSKWTLRVHELKSIHCSCISRLVRCEASGELATDFGQFIAAAAEVLLENSMSEPH